MLAESQQADETCGVKSVHTFNIKHGGFEICVKHETWGDFIHQPAATEWKTTGRRQEGSSKVELNCLKHCKNQS